MEGTTTVIPLAPPPSGSTSNCINPDDSHATASIVVCSAGLAIAVVFVSLRVYAKLGALHVFGWEDGQLPRIIIMVAQ